MRFEYNTNLLFDERIELVAKEIVDVYPDIDIDDALVAAAHAVPVDDKLTNDDRFDRYFFILKTIGRKHRAFYKVFNDAYALYQAGLEKESYKKAMLEMISYANCDTDILPDLV